MISISLQRFSVQMKTFLPLCKSNIEVEYAYVFTNETVFHS